MMKSMVYVCFLDEAGDAAVIPRDLFDKAKADGLIPPAPAGDCDIVNGGLRSLSWARRVIKRAVDFELCNTSSPPSSYAQKLAVSALGAQSVHDAAAMLGFMRAEGMQHDNAS